MTFATPIHGVISVLDRLRTRDARGEDQVPMLPSPVSAAEVRFESWRIVRWDDETTAPLTASPSAGPVCARDPIAAQRTERNRRVRRVSA